MDLHRELYFAVENDDPVKLEALISDGINVNEVFEDTMNISTQTILHFCCVKGRTQCAKLLIDAGANLYARDNWGLTPLVHAVGVQSTDIVDLLLSKDPGIVDIQDNYGKAALHCAVDNNFEDCVEMLIRYGADVNIQNDDGVTPASVCCLLRGEEYDITNVLRMLIEAGADVNLKNGRGKRTALQNACLTKKVKAVELLLAAGADPNTLDAGGRTPLTNLICECIRSYQTTQTIDVDVSTIMIMLIQGGSDINMMARPESNPLIAAVTVKAEPLVSFFLENGAETDVKFITGITPLLVAVTKNDISIVKILLHWNCNLYIKGRIFKRRQNIEHMFDPFELAVLERHLDIMQLLFSAGYKQTQLTEIFRRTDLPPTFHVDEVISLWIRERASAPRSLLDLCVFAVREALQRRVVLHTDKLPLPTRIKEMVLLKHLLSPG